MSLVIKGQFGLIVDAVREKRPVIHHLTNYVTAGDCARQWKQRLQQLKIKASQ